MLKSPFPYFGGKSRVAEEVWRRFGDVKNYVEPFCGSCAMLLARPTAPKIETINDLDGFVANFWRALQKEPQKVARWADWPINEVDLHSRHEWLMQQNLRERMLHDPDFYDCKIAGWWVWGQSMWLGSGWCKWPTTRQRPNLRKGQCGVHRTSFKKPQLWKGNRGVLRLAYQKPVFNSGTVVHRQNCDLYEYLQALSDRLRNVRICCGDWTRVCTPSVTAYQGETAVFLDPPYGGKTGRDKDLYATDSLTVSDDVRKWAIDHGDNPMFRIALCGYEGEHDMPANWSKFCWTSLGGYTKKRKRNHLERIWFSPHCLTGEEEVSTKSTTVVLNDLTKTDLNVAYQEVLHLHKPEAPAVVKADDMALEVVHRMLPQDAERLISFEGKLQLIRDRVRSVAEKYHTGCYLVGRPGVSKTFTVKEELARLGVPFVVKNARMTAWGMFNVIATFPDHVVVLDDIASLFKDQQAMQVFLAAIDGGPQETRTVTYKTKTGNERVQFRGGIIAISNLPLRHDPLAKALGSRIVLLEHEPSDEEIAAFMRKLARNGSKALSPNECLEVTEFLIAETRQLDQRLDLRHLNKALEDFRQDKEGRSETPWQELVRSSLRKLGPQAVLPISKKEEIELQRERVRELVKKYPGDTQRQLAESGLSKSTFYQRLREVRSVA